MASSASVSAPTQARAVKLAPSITRKWFTWEPQGDTGAAIITWIIMIPAYYQMIRWWSAKNEGTILLIALVHGVLATAIPALYLLVFKRRPLFELGITFKNLIPSLLLSFALGALLVRIITATLSGLDTARLSPLAHFLFHLVSFWEPFFVFGWLQTRFERAFGIVPAILLATVACYSYHLPVLGADGSISVGIRALLGALIYALTRNLFALWPITWGLSNGIGHLSMGAVYGWDDVLVTGAIAFFFCCLLIYWVQPDIEQRLLPEEDVKALERQNRLQKSKEEQLALGKRKADRKAELAARKQRKKAARDSGPGLMATLFSRR